MYHRYAVESTASMIAGQDYIYGMRGDQRTPTKGVSVDDQRKALDALAMTLRPNELTLPKHVLDLIPRVRQAGESTRAVSADHRDTCRSAQPGNHRRRRHDRLYAGARCAARMVAQHASTRRRPGWRTSSSG